MRINHTIGHGLVALATWCGGMGMADEMALGRELPVTATLGIGGCMDATLEGDTLYVVGNGRLRIYDVTEPAAPRPLGVLKGLGGVRQVVVRSQVAYVTSREQGLFLVDVADPAKPVLLSHYDTIELATGIEASGPVAYVACRTYGVELIDVRDPVHPRHLSTVRTGEAQSCVVRDGILYVGVWHSREVVICDVHDPWHPAILSRAPLDGYGDGVFLRGGLCFAATGHHAKGLRKRDETDPAFGAGHGLDILDVSDPAHPRAVSSLKLPPFYHIGMDMWDVAAVGDYAMVGDTHNGVFLVDIRDVSKPHILGHHQLPPPKGRKRADAVGGFALGKGVVYVAGSASDLHILQVPEIMPPPREADTPPAVPPRPSPKLPPGFRAYRPEGQVWAVAMHGEVARAACGAAGIHTVAIAGEPRGLGTQPTTGFAVDVRTHGAYVYVAESEGGLSIWEAGEGAALRLVGRLADRQPIRQVVLTPDGRRALLAAGRSSFLVADVSDPANPKVIFRDTEFGLLYGYQIMPGLLQDRYALCFWHVSGAYWYDVAGDSVPTRTSNRYPHRLSAVNGFAMLPNGKQALFTTSHGKYALIEPAERRPVEELQQYGIDGVRLNGKPTIFDSRLYVADRFQGKVVALDISEVTKPRLLAQYQLANNPGMVVEHAGKMLIPGGYDGLLVAPIPGL